uniref:Transposase n=2 Tax=Candidatus Kentrum sp. FW TaxID=2126338 RepID=A0A450TKV9_9GAMM|nr:MAG: Transposase [Candidatus Kentron sp. FW]
MRKIQEVLRLAHEQGLGIRAISRCINASPSTVGDYLRRAKVAGLTWPLPTGLDEAALEGLLFKPHKSKGSQRHLPDWAYIHKERRRKGVTLALLWQEYKAQYPDGLQYSQFTQKYRLWQGKLDVVMRQDHRAGEKLFVDYAGQTVPVIDRNTGEIRQAQVFVAVLGASNYTFAEATWSQGLPDWISSHTRAFQYLDGCPQVVVPDNLRSAVSKAHRYEPDINPTYQELAHHYRVMILPTRVRKPRDKAKVEAGVLVVERWILARLRNQTFFSLLDLNFAIRKLLIQLNDRPFKKLPGSRRHLFESLDKPALKPLPRSAYAYAEWKKVRVNIDYHVELKGHYYSVPYQLVKRELDMRYTANTVECFHKGKRVASHPRSHLQSKHTTLSEHMPEAHRRYGNWSPQRIIRWAQNFGPDTAKLITHILTSRRYPQQGFRSCLGILRLGKTYGDKRLEKACNRVLILNAYSVKSVQSILKCALISAVLTITSETQGSITYVDTSNLG